ncbi:MAG: type IV pilus twitching motility protein PilT [Verrucomicrobium sp.]|nr:type IV pilus twitching motility protein PilT [Verrucomicrobium sp.]
MSAIAPLFQALIDQGGSDLHLLEGAPPKIRLHGDLRPLREEPLTQAEMAALLQPLAGEENWRHYLEAGDLDFAHEFGEAARFRCNYYRQLHGMGAVFRIIPSRIKTIAELGVPPAIQAFGDLQSGLVLVTGPTGSGKSTTLAAVIDYINSTYARHIVTIEEPIEFVHADKQSRLTQREVPQETPTFASGLRAALREDADVVLVGEMRDLETISLALTAAETGLLVFGTLHTNNARKTIDRIIDAFPADQQEQIRVMLANSLRGVCAQLLFKRADGKGRLALNEILVATPAVGAIVREGATAKLVDVLKSGRAEGMQLMDDAIEGALRQGLITAEEAYMKAIDKQRFEAGAPAPATA